MHIVRRSLILLLTPIFTILLFATALDWGVVKTVGQPAAMKQLVAESGLYSTVIPNLMDQVKQVQTQAGQIPLSDPTIRQAANQAFPPSLVQKNSEAAIDSIYTWLDGKTAQPTFQIDLTGAKDNFAANLAAAVEQKAGSLPACTTPYTSTAFDVYSATCLPPGVSPTAIAQIVKNDAGNSPDFIEKTTISADSISNSGSNKSVFSDQLKNFPKQYQRAKKTPTILIILTLITGASLAFLATSRRKGLRHVGIILLVIGAVMLIFAWSLNKANTQILQPKIKLNNAVLETDMKKLSTDIVQRIDKNYWVFGGIYLVLGASAIVLPNIIRRPKPADTHHQPEVPETPAVQEPKTTVPKPAKKRQIKIQ